MTILISMVSENNSIYCPRLHRRQVLGHNPVMFTLGVSNVNSNSWLGKSTPCRKKGISWVCISFIIMKILSRPVFLMTVEAQMGDDRSNLTMGPQPKTTKTIIRSFFKFKSLDSPSTSRGINLTQEMATRPSAQH